MENDVTAVIGMDLGGTKLAAALLSEEGDVLHKTVAPLEHREGAAVGALVGRQAQDVLSYAASQSVTVRGVGISVPGIYYAGTGQVWAPNIPGWECYPLLRELQEEVGPQQHVRIDSDRACHLLGEAWKGAAQGCSHAVFVAVGTGIGAGIMMDGTILRGAQDAAGAIGWLALDRPYRPAYDACGCFEYHASGTGLAKIARELLKKEEDYAGSLREVEPLTAEAIFSTYQDHRDPIATQVIANAVAYWGMAVANLVSLFNPEVIIFGGGLFGPAAAWIPQIVEEAGKWAQPISMRHVAVKATQLEGDAALYGAGRLAGLAENRA